MRWVLLCVLFLTATAVPSSPKNQPIQIEIGEPNIWTLEQAHYLLARLRAADQGLQNAPPTPADLDPNQIQATRMQILQSMFNAELTFDQTVGVKNQFALQTSRADFDRKQALRSKLDDLNTKRLTVIQQLTDLNAQLQKAANETNKDEQNVLNAQITGKTAEKTALDNQITSTQSELSAITVSQPGLSTATPTSTPQLPSSALSKIMQGTPPGVGAPKLHASTVLDNYIQMQYEIVAKQLTLLRDEIGPYNRLVFVEMPYSIYATPTDKNKNLVQVQWNIEGYYERTPDLTCVTRVRQYVEHQREAGGGLSNVNAESDPVWRAALYQTGGVSREALMAAPHLLNAGSPPCAVEKRLQFVLRIEADLRQEQQNRAFFKERMFLYGELSKGPGRADCPKQDGIATPSNPDCLNREANKYQELLDAQDWFLRKQSTYLERLKTEKQTEQQYDLLLDEYEQTYDDLRESEENVIGTTHARRLVFQDVPYWKADIEYYSKLKAGQPTGQQPLDNLRSPQDAGSPLTLAGPIQGNGAVVRVIDLIPRQSALNVNQTFDTVKGFAFSAKFMALFGMGGKLDYQRQRENYEQFVHQDVFATGRGKGLTSFGWTFGPQPGSGQIKPGVRTTYAVLIVPKNAVAIKLRGRGYYFCRTEQPVTPADAKAQTKQGFVEQSFLLTIPPTQEGFYITAADYTPAKPGDYITMYLRGSYFSPQIGVLVNGVPLQRVVGIAQQDLNLSASASGSGTAQIRGQFEQVNQQALAMSFTMGPTFQGTPAISLVTPEKAVDIMYYGLCINAFEHQCPVNPTETLFEHAQVEPMFSAPLTLTAIKTLGFDPARNGVRLLVSGSGFRDQLPPASNGFHAPVTTEILVNGRPLTQIPKENCEILLRPNEFCFLSSTGYFMDLAPVSEPTIDIVVSQSKSGIKVEAPPLSMSNPFRPQVSQVEIISDTPVNSPSTKRMQVHLQGTGMNLVNDVRVVSGANGVAVMKISATDLVLTLESPSEPITVILDGTIGENGSLVTIKKPQPPRITSITNTTSPKKDASGSEAGGDIVKIHGNNLNGVIEAKFGPTAGEIQPGANDTDIDVKIPKGTGQVHVLLKTNVAYLGKMLDNAADQQAPSTLFTYTKETPKESSSTK